MDYEIEFAGKLAKQKAIKAGSCWKDSGVVGLMKKSEYEISFWEKWLDAGLERDRLVEKLPFFKMSLKMKDNKFFRHAFATMLNGYFEDIESAVYTKISLERKKGGRKRG